jgi:phage terminase large subunit-like protein
MLSNTAVPKYYGQFREDVLAGRIPVCREVVMEMNRIDDLIARPDIYYDESIVEGWVEFCNNELTLTDGSDMYLLDSFKLWAEQLLGWFEVVERSSYDPELGRYVKKRFKKRLTKKQYLIVGRGAAKSMYGSCIHAYYLNIDTSTTQQLTVAPTMKMGLEMLMPIKTAIVRARGPLFQFLTEGKLQTTNYSKADRQKLAATQKGIENFLTNSVLEVAPMTIDKLQGRRDKVSTIDEWLSTDVREDVVGAVEQGAMKNGNDDYVIICMSSEGTVRNSTGDAIKMELMKILRGEYYAPHVSIWYYKLDDQKEVEQPEMWMKANPNIGKTITYESYQQAVDRAANNPSTRNDILAKLFGIPLESYSYYFTYEETLMHDRRINFDGMPCAMGIDLSMGDDFCAFTFLCPLPGERIGVKTICYISSLTMLKLPGSTRLRYHEFLDEGSLVVLEGVALDMMQVYEDLDAHIIAHEYDIRAVGYDPFNANEFIERWKQENGPYGVDKVIQGARTESVPLGELKKLAEEGLILFDQKLMQFCMGNAITLEDTNGMRKLYKKKAEQKIDSVAAMMDAYIAWKRVPDAFE